MRGNELRAERIRQNKSARYMARLIGKTADSYRRRERGIGKFNDEEIGIIAMDLSLDPCKLDRIFFDSNLRYSKFRCEQSTEL